MITSFEANNIAIAKIRELTGPFDSKLATSSNQPIQLPGGWRFPYNLLLNGVRVGEQLVILFVDTSGEVKLEWGEENLKKSQENKSAQIEGFSLSLRRLWEGVKFWNSQKNAGDWAYQAQQQKLPPLGAIEDYFREEFPVTKKSSGMQVETSEQVVVLADNHTIQSYWRIGLLDKDEYRRYSTRVSYGPDGKSIQHGKLKPQSRGAAPQWHIGRSQCRSSGNLVINLKNLPADQTILRNQWLVWSCIAYAVEYLADLGYRYLNQHTIRIEFSESNSTESPRFGRTDNIPVISFFKGGWADDPTIVCHELCHAIWDLLFTRAPIALAANSPDKNESYDGICEGFADYFAAALLRRDKPFDSVAIGQSVPQETIEKNKHNDILPRVINGQPPVERVVGAKEQKYMIGLRWANMLWDLRRRVGAADADKIIFLAHFKPRVDDNTPNNVMAAYFQSLRRTAEHLGIYFDGWGQLARDHHLAVA